MKKSISLLLAAVMVFALAAIACADATTVTAWISDGAETVIYTSMFDDFNSKHDDIQVDYQFFAQDELLKIYRREYKHRFAWIRTGKISKDAFMQRLYRKYTLKKK